jgi:hypothetical protein
MSATTLCMRMMMEQQCVWCTWLQVMAKLLQKYHGNITSENIMQNIAPIVQTGNLHVAMYDLTSQVSVLAACCVSACVLLSMALSRFTQLLQIMYVTFAAKDGSPPPLMGYDRQYTFLNVTALVNEPLTTLPPASEAPADMFPVV